MPSATKRTFRASGAFLFLLMVLAGIGGTLAWWFYVDHAETLNERPFQFIVANRIELAGCLG
jgi:hypothetical protein